MGNTDRTDPGPSIEVALRPPAAHSGSRNRARPHRRFLERESDRTLGGSGVVVWGAISFLIVVRLHAGMGYVTPYQEHRGEGAAIRAARQYGLSEARQRRIAYHRNHQPRGPRNAD